MPRLCSSVVSRIASLTSVLGLLILFESNSVFAQESAFRDPTQPLGARGVAVKDTALELQAIYIRADRKEAVINGKLLQEGDIVNGARVIKIDAKAVIYSKAGQQLTARLRKSILEKE